MRKRQAKFIPWTCHNKTIIGNLYGRKKETWTDNHWKAYGKKNERQIE